MKLVIMLHDILFVLWFFLPAGVANAAPVITAALPGFKHWNAPLDGGLQLRGKRIFGDHKTWRGLISGILAATLILWLEQWLIGRYAWAASIAAGHEYLHIPTLLAGPIVGFGVLGGDAIKSFFKRRVGVTPGKSWFPFDQLDYIIGGTVALWPFVQLSISQLIWLVILWFGLHLIVSYIGYLVKLKKQPI